MSVRFGTAAAAAMTLSLLLAAIPAAADARQKPITGKLAKRGYTLIALSSKGKASSKRVSGRTFSVRPPTGTVSLHLRDPGGGYGGPVVVGKRKDGKRAVVGVKAGAELGKIEISTSRGYARLAKKPPKRWIDADRLARAKNGIPTGAGTAGLVRSKLPGDPVRGDRDFDGIPDGLDVDDDGDLILDGYDRSAQPRSSATISQSEGGDLDISTALDWTPFGPVNANGGSTDEQLAAAQANGGMFGVLASLVDPGSAELDCGGLVYCSAGGTGRLIASQLVDPSDPRAGLAAFPECCDADGDGLGSWTPRPPEGIMFLSHGATSAQIHADDVLIQRGTIDGTAVSFPSTVGFVYSSHPVVAAYDDGQGNAGAFSYPPPEECRPARRDQPPGGACARPVRANANGDVVLRLTLWRPQRPRTAGDPGSGAWIDAGNLAYATYVTNPAGGGSFCPQSAYTATDPTLTPLADSPLPGMVPSGTAFADLRGDQPASSANTFSYTLNLTQCAASLGFPLTAQVPMGPWAFAVDSDPETGPSAFAHSEVAFSVQP